jgi:predicted AlkP superfamily phosphohydrolase/phosphomutase
MTGLTPADHGVRKLEPQQNQQSWGGEPIWEKIDGYSGIANVPLTYPPEEMRGWMVTGLMTPKKAIYTYPRGLYKELDELGYRIDVWVEEHKNHPHGHYGTMPFEFSQEYRDELLERLKNVMAKRKEAFNWLIQNEPVDFMFLCFTTLDRVQHIAFDNTETVKEFYELLDSYVGNILQHTPDDTDIFLTSDHGFQEIDLPDTDIVGEHRVEGYAASNTSATFRDLESLHNAVVESANRSESVEERLGDLGYLE